MRMLIRPLTRAALALVALLFVGQAQAQTTTTRCYGRQCFTQFTNAYSRQLRWCLSHNAEVTYQNVWGQWQWGDWYYTSIPNPSPPPATFSVPWFHSTYGGVV